MALFFWQKQHGFLSGLYDTILSWMLALQRETASRRIREATQRSLPAAPAQNGQACI